MKSEHLSALLAVLDHGTFEAAARSLHMTPSAMSQRIRALEREVGQVLVRRTKPAEVTGAGAVVARLARQSALLEAEALRELGDGPDGAPTPLPIAVNADSLALWFPAVLRDAAGWRDTTLRISVDDQDHTSRLMSSGDVLGAISSSDEAVAGSSVTPLGSMRYLPVATAGLAERFALGEMPVVVFGADDDLQARYLRERGVAGGPQHLVPSSEAFAQAVRAGLGWGMVPELQLLPQDESLTRLPGHIDVPLFWRHWRLESPRLGRLSDAIVAAAAVLRPADVRRGRRAPAPRRPRLASRRP